MIKAKGVNKMITDDKQLEKPFNGHYINIVWLETGKNSMKIVIRE